MNPDPSTLTSDETPIIPEVPAGGDPLLAERDRLALEKADLQDLLLRRQADFENFRRRVERERQDTVEYAGMETVKALLPALDDFERALKVAAASADAAPPEFQKGMELVHGRLLDALKKLGLEPISAEGRAFDPHQHEAIDRAVSDEVEDETVLAEYQRGYLFKGRLLRPALVKVAVRG